MSPKRTKTEGELLEELQTNAPDPVNVPWIYRWTRISHYYGDIVRELLMACAILMLIAAPFYTNNLKLELPFIVIGAAAMVCVAALTSPMKRGVISADAVTSGTGFVIYEIWAMLNYETDPLYKFALRQAIAILFLFALYFSTKTLRNMVMRTMGKSTSSEPQLEGPQPGITNDVEPQLNWKEQAHEALEDLNEREKREFTD
jgi:hypothetical protein